MGLQAEGAGAVSDSEPAFPLTAALSSNVSHCNGCSTGVWGRLPCPEQTEEEWIVGEWRKGGRGRGGEGLGGRRKGNCRWNVKVKTTH